MRSRAEILFRWTAAVTGLLTLVALGAAASGFAPAAWAMLGFIYVSSVSYGFSEMIRLFERHKRRCRDCLEGVGPHLRWWVSRVVLVVLVSALPVFLLLPLFSSFTG